MDIRFAKALSNNYQLIALVGHPSCRAVLIGPLKYVMFYPDPLVNLPLHIYPTIVTGVQRCFGSGALVSHQLP